MNSKKIISVIFAAIVATNSISTFAYAEENYSVGGYAPHIYHNFNEEFTQGNFKFAPVEDGNLYVTGLVDRSVTNITIPSSVNGRRVTIIDGAAFSRCPNLTSVYIPNGVLWIGEAAFSGSDKLKSIKLPDSITTIDESAFSYCDSLQEITLSKDLVTLATDAFNGCKNLKNIYYPKTKAEFEMAARNGLYEAGITESDELWRIFDGTITYYNGTEYVSTKATIHYNASPSSQTTYPGTTPVTTDPYLELALSTARYNLSLAENNLKNAQVDLENAKKKKVWVYSDGGFKQTRDEEAIREAELTVQLMELAYQKTNLDYQKLLSQYNTGSTSVVKGDINNDGTFNLSDITTLLKLYVNGNTNPTKHDFNNDGKVDLSDVTSMMRYYVNN